MGDRTVQSNFTPFLRNINMNMIFLRVHCVCLLIVFLVAGFFFRLLLLFLTFICFCREYNTHGMVQGNTGARK